MSQPPLIRTLEDIQQLTRTSQQQLSGPTVVPAQAYVDPFIPLLRLGRPFG